MSSAQFFERFVATRTPVVIRAPLESTSHLEDGWWLQPSKEAGRVQLQVEHRSSDKQRFGRGLKRSMSYANLVEELRAGSTRYYLTTQEEHAPEDHIIAPPLRQMSADLAKAHQRGLPARPALLASLVPQSINLWLGRSSQPGTSSGLHHDYHDNL